MNWVSDDQLTDEQLTTSWNGEEFDEYGLSKNVMYAVGATKVAPLKRSLPAISVLCFSALSAVLNGVKETNNA